MVHMVDVFLFLFVRVMDYTGERAYLASDDVWSLPFGQQLVVGGRKEQKF